jgi:hypothetical protein
MSFVTNTVPQISDTVRCPSIEVHNFSDVASAPLMFVLSLQVNNLHRQATQISLDAEVILDQQSWYKTYEDTCVRKVKYITYTLNNGPFQSETWAYATETIHTLEDFWITVINKDNILLGKCSWMHPCWNANTQYYNCAVQQPLAQQHPWQCQWFNFMWL